MERFALLNIRLGWISLRLEAAGSRAKSNIASSIAPANGYPSRLDQSVSLSLSLSLSRSLFLRLFLSLSLPRRDNEAARKQRRVMSFLCSNSPIHSLFAATPRPHVDLLLSFCRRRAGDLANVLRAPWKESCEECRDVGPATDYR